MWRKDWTSYFTQNQVANYLIFGIWSVNKEVDISRLGDMAAALEGLTKIGKSLFQWMLKFVDYYIDNYYIT